MKYKAINQLIEKYFRGLTHTGGGGAAEEYFEQEKFLKNGDRSGRFSNIAKICRLQTSLLKLLTINNFGQSKIGN